MDLLELKNENLELRLQLAELQANTKTSLVHAAIMDVMSDITAIGKGKQAGSGNYGYKFRGIDDVYNRVHPLLKKHGLAIIPVGMKDVERGQYKTARGAIMNTISATAQFKVVARDGSYEMLEILTSGDDSGDKASGKAMSYAHKYALVQLFAIPVRDMPDTDVKVPKSEKKTLPAERFAKMLEQIAAGNFSAESAKEKFELTEEQLKQLG